MPDLRDDVAALRQLHGAYCCPPYGKEEKTHEAYVEAAVNLAPRLADAWEQSLAMIAERDAEILRLRELLKPFAAAYEREVESARIMQANRWSAEVDAMFRASVFTSDLKAAADALKGGRDE